MESVTTVSYSRITRRGALRHEVGEAYRRGDLGCGRLHGEVCPAAALADAATAAKAAGEACGWVVPDTNVILHQLDVLEHSGLACAPLDRLVIAQTVALEVRHRDRQRFRRLCSLIEDPAKSVVLFANEHVAGTAPDRGPLESANDANDRAVRRVAAFVARAIAEAGGPGDAVVLATDDAACRALAAEEGVRALTTRALCDALDQPALADKVAVNDGFEEERGERPKLYATHRPMSELLKAIAAGELLQGVFRADRRSNWHGSVAVRIDGREASIRVDGAEAVNRALDGDHVAVKIGDKGEAPEEEEDAPDVARSCGDDVTRKAEQSGAVVGIIKREEHRALCGSVACDEADIKRDRARVLFCPVDRRFPKVALETRQLQRLAGMRIVVIIDAWADDERYPRGHYVETLGERGDRATETKVILREFDVATAPFSPDVLACLPPAGEDFAIDDAERATRVDLRGLDVCSIDPPGCRDIDDALHCVGPRENGNYQVGVHIADVTHFCASGSPLDLEAAKRGTSTYLVDRRLDMLPLLLTANLCSLRGGVERLAFSALMELTPEGEVVAADFRKTVIRSRAALTYHQAQVMIDDSEGTRDASAVAASVRKLALLARKLRARRLAAGALTLASPEVKFELSNESDSPTDVGAYALVEANSTVEEFMLLANVEVAKKLLATFPALSLLRCHPAPPPERFEALIGHAARRNFPIDVATSKRLADSLDAAEDPADPYLNKLLRILATRCMAPAKYFSSAEKEEADYAHYGLAAPTYTHFTSPIRRYADVVAHRLLAAAIGRQPLPPALAATDSKKALADLCQGLNRRNMNAQQAGRASVALYTRLFFKEHPQPSVEARVIALRPDRLDLLVPRYGIEATVHLTPKGADAEAVGLALDDAHHSLSWTSNGAARRVSVFDAVTVSIVVAAPTSAAEDVGTIKVELLDPPPPDALKRAADDGAPPAKRVKT